jgi:hypothetical protein
MGSARLPLRNPCAISAILWKTRLPASGIPVFREKLSRNADSFSGGLGKICRGHGKAQSIFLEL